MKKYVSTTLIAVTTLLIGIFSGMAISEKNESDPDGSRSSMRSQTHGLRTESQAYRAKLSKFELALGKPLSTFEDKIQYFTDASDYLRGGMSPMGFDTAIYNDLKLVAAAMSLTEMKRALTDIQEYKISSSAKSWLRTIIIIEFTNKNPPEALAYIAAHRDDPLIANQQMIALQNWMKTDPDAANLWLRENKSHVSVFQQSQLKSNHIIKLCKTDFPEAMKRLKAMDSLERNRVIFRLQFTLPHEPEQRTELIHYLMTFEDKTQLMDTGVAFVRSIADRDPQEGIKFLEEWPGGKKYRIQNTLATAWARSNPKAAADWLINQPSAAPQNDPAPMGEKFYAAYRDNALGQIFSQWTSHDEEEAMKWLTEQNDINADPLYTATSAHHATYGNLAEAFEWANKIEYEPKRREEYGNLINRWSSRDLDGLKKWLDAQPAAMRQKLTKGTMVGHLYSPPE